MEETQQTCLSSMHPSGVWMYVQGPHLPWSWLLQRQKKRITPILRPYHLFTHTTVRIHFYCNRYREDMFVFRTYILWLLEMCCYRIFVNVTTADFKRLSLRLTEEQVNTILHSLWQVIAIVCALRVFQLKGFGILFFCVTIIKCEVGKWSK